MSETSTGQKRRAKPLGKRQLAGMRAELEGEQQRLGVQISRLERDFADESWKDRRSDDEVESGSVTSERERVMSLAQHARTQLEQVEAALERMDAGTFGVCVRCGRRIASERLAARPQSVLCLDCQRAAERLR